MLDRRRRIALAVGPEVEVIIEHRSWIVRRQRSRPGDGSSAPELLAEPQQAGERSNTSDSEVRNAHEHIGDVSELGAIDRPRRCSAAKL